MTKSKHWIMGLAVGLTMGVASAVALAHGDVTPKPVDTTGLKPLGKDWLPANPYRSDAKAVEIGAVGYLHNCAGCHGLKAESGGMAPDLLADGKDCVDMSGATQEACWKDTDGAFKDFVLTGKKNSEGRSTMPAYGGVFTQEAVWAIKAYIDARTVESARQ